MRTRFFSRAAAQGLALWVCLTSQPAESRDSLETAEIRECRRNLHLIHEAIQAYRRVYHDVPDRLADLLPEFLSDAQYLTCPAAQRFGLTSQDVTRWKQASQTTYGYEFGRGPIPTIISGGSPRPLREWKQLQMGLVGSEVPIVRCHTHEQAVLNLSFGGRIYESTNIDWEPLFEDKVEIWDLTHVRRFSAHAVTKKIVVPKREIPAGRNLIDLSPYYTDLLDEPWPGEGSMRPLSALPPGTHEIHGTSFDVRGLVQLGAARPGLIAHPRTVAGIVVERPARRVNFLLGCRHAVEMGTTIADCMFRFGNGQRRHFQIRYGHHVFACLSTSSQVTTSLADGRLAWRSEIGERQAAHLYECEWINPLPEETISAMDFVTQFGEAGPFLVALTIEPPP